MTFLEKKIDPKTGTVTIIEAGYKYEVPEILYKDLKLFIFQFSLVSRWYKQLSDADREKVVRVSAYE